MAAAGGDLLQGQLGDRPGQGDRDITEADADRRGRLLDVADDRAGPWFSSSVAVASIEPLDGEA